MKSILLTYMLSSMAWSAEAVSSPVLGLVRDSGELRRLHGIPGSMDLGDAVAIPSDASVITVAARQHWMILQRDEQWFVFDWQRQTMEHLGEPADRVAVSPSGNEAVLFRKDLHRVQVLTNLPHNLQSREHTLSEVESMEHLALSSGGESVAMVTNGRLLLVTRDGNTRELYQSEGITAMTFLPDENALLVADRLQNSVLRVQTGRSAEPLLSSENGLDVPTAIWAGTNGRIAVISAKRELLWTFENGSWDFQTIAGLARMEEMQLRDTLLLLNDTGEPLGIEVFGGAQKTYRLPQPAVTTEVN